MNLSIPSFDRQSRTSVGMLAAAMVAICVASRLMPHPPNVSPVASMAIFAGVAFARRGVAVAVPLIAMLISDALIGFHGLMWAVYGCMAANVLAGVWLSRRPGVGRGVVAVLGGSTLFFVVTNLAVWASWYPATPAGLVACFTAAVPFFQNSLIGDVCFSGLMLGGWALATRLAADDRRAGVVCRA